MLIPQANRTYFLLLLGFSFLSVASAGIFLQYFASDVQLEYEPLHSSIEGIGAVQAILMALLLLHLYQDNGKQKEEYFLLSMGFLMMGILDGFHSIAVINHGFIMLRSLANIFSGFWFALLWLPNSARYIVKIKAFPWIVTLISVLIGIMTIKYRELFPFMLHNHGFTPFAICINTLAGIFSMAAGLFYLRRFVRYSTTESYLFACMFLMLGLSGLEFVVSGLWTYLWWFWHAERVLAYIVVLVYMVKLFLWKSHEVKRMNEVLEDRINERTKELVYEVAERTRYGLERDKVIIDLEDAQQRIKTLTGLLPICSSCKKIRNADGNWEQLESYIHEHSEASFTHGLCLECANILYPEIFIKNNLNQKTTAQVTSKLPPRNVDI